MAGGHIGPGQTSYMLQEPETTLGGGKKTYEFCREPGTSEQASNAGATNTLAYRTRKLRDSRIWSARAVALRMWRPSRY